MRRNIAPQSGGGSQRISTELVRQDRSYCRFSAFIGEGMTTKTHLSRHLQPILSAYE
jgi:hypothetical protein